MLKINDFLFYFMNMFFFFLYNNVIELEKIVVVILM